MNPEPNNVDNTEVKKEKHPVFQVTKTSKYLALALFIIMPFIGGWIGYTYAPERVVEVERVVLTTIEQPLSTSDDLIVEQTMWASKVAVNKNREVLIKPFFDFDNTNLMNLNLPNDWTISYSEQTKPDESKTLRFTDPNLPGKPETDAVGANVALSFLRVDTCEESFRYLNNANYWTLDSNLSTDEINVYTSGWVTNRTMGSVPSKDICIENKNDDFDVIHMNLHPVSEENKTVLDQVVSSIR